MKPGLHNAASKLAQSKSSWVPFTTPAVSEAARTLAKARNSHRAARASAKSHTRMRASGAAKARKSASRTGTRSRTSSAKRSRSSR